jgi:hypothetical protein
MGCTGSKSNKLEKERIELEEESIELEKERIKNLYNTLIDENYILKYNNDKYSDNTSINLTVSISDIINGNNIFNIETYYGSGKTIEFEINITENHIELTDNLVYDQAKILDNMLSRKGFNRFSNKEDLIKDHSRCKIVKGDLTYKYLTINGNDIIEIHEGSKITKYEAFKLLNNRNVITFYYVQLSNIISIQIEDNCIKDFFITENMIMITDEIGIKIVKKSNYYKIWSEQIKYIAVSGPYHSLRFTGKWENFMPVYIFDGKYEIEYIMGWHGLPISNYNYENKENCFLMSPDSFEDRKYHLVKSYNTKILNSIGYFDYKKRKEYYKKTKEYILILFLSIPIIDEMIYKILSFMKIIELK